MRRASQRGTFQTHVAPKRPGLRGEGSGSRWQGSVGVRLQSPVRGAPARGQGRPLQRQWLLRQGPWGHRAAVGGGAAGANNRTSESPGRCAERQGRQHGHPPSSALHPGPLSGSAFPGRCTCEGGPRGHALIPPAESSVREAPASWTLGQAVATRGPLGRCLSP